MVRRPTAREKCFDEESLRQCILFVEILLATMRCAAYTRRVAISNRRLLALEQGNVTFRGRDSAHANKQRLLTLPVDEFLSHAPGSHARTSTI
jgi:hypothetical protein